MHNFSAYRLHPNNKLFQMTQQEFFLWVEKLPRVNRVALINKRLNFMLAQGAILKAQLTNFNAKLN